MVQFCMAEISPVGGEVRKKMSDSFLFLFVFSIFICLTYHA